MKNRTLEKLLDIGIVICCGCAIVFLSGVSVSGIVDLGAFSSLFAIATVLSFLYYFCEFVYLFKGGKGILFSLGKFICFTSVTFCALFALVFMQPFYRNASENVKIAYLCMHSILPCLVLAEYVVSDKGHYNKGFIVTYMILFILYGGILLLCGQYTSIGYPYAFLDHGQLGYKLVGEECILLTIVMYVYGKIVIGIDRLFRKRGRK